MKSRLENSVLACGREGPKIQYTGMGDIACPQTVEVEALPKKLVWVALRTLCLVFQRRPGVHAHRQAVAQ